MRPCLTARALLGLLLSVCSPLVLLHAQQTGEDRFSLRGSVVNSATGEAVGGALVQIQGRAQFTGADGTFEFTGLTRGQVTVVARKPGFFNDQELGRLRMVAAVNISSESDVIVKLTPEGLIYGQIKDENDQPIEGITVRVQRWRAEGGERQLQALGQAMTDDLGNFRIAGLLRGTYYLSFQHSGNGWRTYSQLAHQKQPQQGYGIQFYPGVSDVASATPIEVHAGAQIHIAQTLYHERVFEISGVVRGFDPEAGFDLMLRNDAGDMMQRSERIDPKTGEFQIPEIPEGDYLLETLSQRPSPDRDPENGQRLNIQIPVQVHSDRPGLVVVLGSGSSIDVQLRDEAPSSTPGEVHRVWIQMTPKGFSQRVSQQVVVPPHPGARRASQRFQGLSSGIYEVRASALQPGYIAALRCGGTDLLREDLAVEAGVSLPPIEVTLRFDGAELSVKVADNGIPAGGDVLVYSSEYPQRSVLLHLGPDATSTIQIAPGTYQVAAIRDADNLVFRDPTTMQKYLAHARSVTLSPRGKTTVNLEMPPEEEQ